MNVNEILVSVGVPVFNGERFIERALKSLVDQTHKKIEIIISDNASTDGTYEIALKFSERYPWVKLVRQPVNCGSLTNFEWVLTHAQGDLFMWAAADDCWNPTFISELASEMCKDTSIGMAMSGVKLFKFQNDVFVETYDPRCESRLFVNATLSMHATIRAICSPIKINYFIYGIFRRDSILNVFDKTLMASPAAERTILLRLACQKKIVFVAKPLYLRTLHASSYEHRHGLLKKDYAPVFIPSFAAMLKSCLMPVSTQQLSLKLYAVFMILRNAHWKRMLRELFRAIRK